MSSSHAKSIVRHVQCSRTVTVIGQLGGLHGRSGAGQGGGYDGSANRLSGKGPCERVLDRRAVRRGGQCMA